MKPEFRGTEFGDIVRYLQRLTLSVFVTRETVNITPSSVAANTVSKQTFPISRLDENESIVVEHVGAQTAGIGIVGARVSAYQVLELSFVNPTGSAATPQAGNYRILRFKP